MGSLQADAQILDGLLTFSRIGDPTAAGGNGEPPQHFKLGSDGVVNVKNGDNDRVLGELKGKVSPFYLSQRLEDTRFMQDTH